MPRVAHEILTVALAICAGAAASPQGVQQPLAPPPRGSPTLPADSPSRQPVDPTVADRGVLSSAPRQMPYELAEPQEFDRVFKAPGSARKFYRASGALFAVFDEAVYRKGKKSKRIVDVPPGTVYYIGEPDWSSLRPNADFAAGTDDLRVALEQRSGEADAASDPVRDITPERGSEASGRAAPDRDRRETEPPPLPTEFVSTHHDVAAMTGRVPAGVDRELVVGEGSDVRPRMIVDAAYRQDRLALLFKQAASQRTNP